MLTGFLPVWDIAKRHVDDDVFSELVDRLQRELVDLGVPARPLSRLHEVLDGEAARGVVSCLLPRLLRSEWRAVTRRLVRSIVPELPVDDVAVQAAAHVRVLVPGDHKSVAPPHTDRAFGHALGERNLWIALTAASSSAALHLLPLAQSLPIEAARAARGTQLVLPDDGGAVAVDVAAGDALLFTPVHVHAARPVPPDTTRVSVDVRILPRSHCVGRNLRSFVPLGGP